MLVHKYCDELNLEHETIYHPKIFRIGRRCSNCKSTNVIYEKINDHYEIKYLLKCYECYWQEEFDHRLNCSFFKIPIKVIKIMKKQTN